VQFALTVPTVLDRFIQQAVMQVLQKRWDPTFSDHSYGFRPRTVQIFELSEIIGGK
jgi:RNA-directed DNA polymerase